jgi:hypothetical protein
MNNPYNLLQHIPPLIPTDCISHIFSFYRPKNILSESIKNNFMRCGVCNDVVKTYDGKIHLRYYTLRYNKCKSCDPNITTWVICKYCTFDINCECDNDSDCDSYFSWFSF